MKIQMEKGDRIVVSSKVSIFHYQGCKGVIVGEWKERRGLRRFDVKLDDGRKVWFDEDEIEKELTEEERINSLDENEKVLLLKLLMEDIRGNWGFDAVERIELIKTLTTSITTLPKGLLNAIRYNAETFDGKFNANETNLH